MRDTPKNNDLQIAHTICDICNPMTHCGIDAHIKDGQVVKVEGTAGNPHSMGRLCSKAPPPGSIFIIKSVF